MSKTFSLCFGFPTSLLSLKGWEGNFSAPFLVEGHRSRGTLQSPLKTKAFLHLHNNHIVTAKSGLFNTPKRHIGANVSFYLNKHINGEKIRLQLIE